MPDQDSPEVPPNAFCQVVRRRPDGTEYYVVHTGTPRFVVEVEREESEAGETGQRQGVIKRVCLPNSAAGDYHRCARLLGAALGFFEQPPQPRPGPPDRFAR